MLDEKPKKTKKVLIFGVISLLVVLLGVGLGLYIVRKPQRIVEKAAVPTGTAKIYISPESKNAQVGDTFTADIFIDTAGIAISGLTVKLEYPYSGETPPISTTNVDINPTLISDGDWDFPYKNVTSQGGQVNIEIAGLSTSIDGYTTSGQEKLATLTMKADKAGTVNVSFNPNESVMASKETEEDVLLIPQSVGVYVVAGNPDATATPTPTSPGATPTPTSSTSATATPTPAGGTGGIATAPPVPQSGIGTHAIAGFLAGMVFLTFSLFLIF